MAIDLVTGATGLVGGNLVRALVGRGRQVRILVRPTSQSAHLDEDGVSGDTWWYMRIGTGRWPCLIESARARERVTGCV